MSKNRQKIPKTIDDFQLEEIDGELLLYSPKATQSIYLNPSASVIWQLCTGANTTQDIIDLLQQQFPESPAEIEKDVLTTIEQFAEQKAINLV